MIDRRRKLHMRRTKGLNRRKNPRNPPPCRIKLDPEVTNGGSAGRFEMLKGLLALPLHPFIPSFFQSQPKTVETLINRALQIFAPIFFFSIIFLRCTPWTFEMRIHIQYSIRMYIRLLRSDRLYKTENTVDEGHPKVTCPLNKYNYEFIKHIFRIGKSVEI